MIGESDPAPAHEQQGLAGHAQRPAHPGRGGADGGGTGTNQGRMKRGVDEWSTPQKFVRESLDLRNLRGDWGHLVAAGADVVVGNLVAADIGVAHGGHSAELHRHRHADVLGDGEHTGAVLHAVAHLTARSDHRGAAALGGSDTRLGEGGDGDGHTDGSGLIAHGGAGLGLTQHLRIYGRKHWNLSFLAIAVFRLCRSGEKGDRWSCIFHGVWYNEREMERGNGICGKAE